MIYYVIEQRWKDWETGKEHREYYTQSSSSKIDRTDIRNAKFFPNVRSLKQGLTWAGGNPKVFEVEVEVKVLREVSPSIAKVF